LANIWLRIAQATMAARPGNIRIQEFLALDSIFPVKIKLCLRCSPLSSHLFLKAKAWRLLDIG
jgi:hypothetical protein